jgi:hypothetical protein
MSTASDFDPSLGDERYDLALIGWLTKDLFDIYQRAGREVTYTDRHGQKRPYWANRFRQSLQRATTENRVIQWTEQLVLRDEATRGFGYLQDNGRLDLSVEWLVADPNRPYHVVFSEEAVAAARARLVEHGVTPPELTPDTGQGRTDGSKAAERKEQPPLPVPGRTFDVRVTVGNGGELTFRLI